MKKVFFILILILILSTFFRLNVFAESTDNSISVNIDDYLSDEYGYCHNGYEVD